MIRPSREAEVSLRAWASRQEWVPALSGSSWSPPGCATFLVRLPSCCAKDDEGLGTGREMSLEESHLLCPGKNSGFYFGELTDP